MTEKELEQNALRQEARIFFTIAPLVGPILEKKRKDCIARMRAAHRAGEREHTALVAELSVLCEIDDEIKRKEQTYNSLLGEPK